MLPNKPMGIGPGAGPAPDMTPQGPGPGTPVGPGDQPSPETVKKQLVMLLSQAKKIAEQNGVDFSAVLSEVEGNKSRSDVPLPKPPTP